MSGRSYLLSWASLSFGLPSLSQCLYYSTLGCICQGVFEKNRNFFSKGYSLFTMGVVATHRVFGLVSQRGWTQSVQCLTLLTFTIISQTFRFVNTFFEKFLAPSGLHTFLTHCVSNHFGEHPFAFRLCYSLLPTLKGTRLG